MDIDKKIEYLHKIFGTKYHFFTMTNSRSVLLRLENDSCCKYSFSGMTMYAAVKEALDYVRQEISAGSLKDIKMKDVADENNKTEHSDKLFSLKKLTK